MTRAGDTRTGVHHRRRGGGDSNGLTAQATPHENGSAHRGDSRAVPGSYIVVFKNSAVTKDAVGAKAGELARQHGGTVGHIYTNALRGFEVNLSEPAAKRLAASPLVKYVEQKRTGSSVDQKTDTPA